MDDGAANLGYQFTANWDKSLGDTYGLSTGLLFTGNALNEESEIFTDGRWRYTAFELGMFLDLCTNLRIKGLLTAGFYGAYSAPVDPLYLNIIDPSIPLN